jgi:Zn-finger nucleic acid-binding protein
MNAAASLHCGGCGRELGLEPVGDPSKASCPVCRQPLAAFVEARGTVFDCGQCAGQFVEHALLVHLLEERRGLGRVAPTRPAAKGLGEQVVRYRPCALCPDLMQRKNFGGTSGVVVDVCSRHGVWFDADELPRVLAFVENGGLERAERRREEELYEARVQQRIVEVAHYADASTLELDAAARGLHTFVSQLLRSR